MSLTGRNSIGGQAPSGAPLSLSRHPQALGSLAADGLSLILVTGALGLMALAFMGLFAVAQFLKGIFG